MPRRPRFELLATETEEKSLRREGAFRFRAFCFSLPFSFPLPFPLPFPFPFFPFPLPSPQVHRRKSGFEL